MDVVEGTSLASLKPNDLGDLLLWLACQPNRTFVALDPSAAGHRIVTSAVGTGNTISTLPVAVADATAARIALISQIDLAAASEQVRRVPINLGARTFEVLVTLRPTPDGLFLELRAIPRASDPAVVADTDQTTAHDRIGIYNVLGEIGRGAMGIVYRAEHEALKKPVAIKVLHKALASDPIIAARFEREGLAASRPRHPGIVDVTDFGRLSSGQSFLVMELVEGETLDVVLHETGAFQPDRSVRIVREIAAALAAAHAVGVIHRDLKPANIFILDDDRVKIGDFGVAKIISGPVGTPRDTMLGAIVGTPHYMAPEQAEGAPVDHRIDIYALGCIFYELLTGHVPFDAETPMSVMSLQMTAPIPPLSSPFGPIPVLIDHIVRRSLAKSPGDRYPSAAALIVELDKVLAIVTRLGWRRWLSS
ncbi:MAG: serine/threonine protein kinase [Deltaproteobacteria bacterium]|nr:serine/threonine protein kinase [Deltaproteobacteria bacterium]